MSPPQAVFNVSSETQTVSPPQAIFEGLVDSPSVSTTGSFLMMAFLLAMRITPMASVTVTTIGRPSGMAATARLKHHNTILLTGSRHHTNVQLLFIVRIQATVAMKVEEADVLDVRVQAIVVGEAMEADLLIFGVQVTVAGADPVSS